MFNKQLKANIKELDEQINKLTLELESTEDENEYDTTMRKIEDLTSVRCKLAENNGKNNYAQSLISGAFGLTAVLVVLRFEKGDNIITSRNAFGLASKMFRG